MLRFHYSCILDGSIEEVFHFHTDIRNLPFITPKWIDVQIVSIDEPFKQHSCVELIIKRFGIPTRWVIEIATMDYPHNITDKMISGPFSHFQHQRFFTPLSDQQTLMLETLTIKLPLGWWGKALHPMIKSDMDAMFAYRHEATKNYFHTRSFND